MGTFPNVLPAITVAYLWTKLFFTEYRTKGIKLLFSEIILSHSLSCVSIIIIAEEVPWDQDFIGIDLEQCMRNLPQSFQSS